MAESVYEYIVSTGTVVADTSDIRTSVVDDVVAVFGCTREVAENDSTIEGRLVDDETARRKSIALNNAKQANQINPNLAEEWAFDAIYALFGGERRAATRSSAVCYMTGVAGTIISAGSYIRNDVTSTLWYTDSDLTLDVDGLGDVIVYSDDAGQISADAGELSKIISSVNGWETVTNSDPAVEGTERQSLISAKISRTVELSRNAGTTMGAVLSNVSAISGVVGVAGRENMTSAPMEIDGITMPAKSTWICVDGGAAGPISEQYVIHTHGTSFYGFSVTESGSYTDPITGQEYSLSSGLPVLIDRPTDVPIMVEVTASLASSVEINVLIKEAVIKWANGNIEGYHGCALSQIISPFEISSALNEYFSASSIYVKKVRVSTVDDNTPGFDEIPIKLWEKSSLENFNITVIPA